MISSQVTLLRIQSEASCLNSRENFAQTGEMVLKGGAVYQNIVDHTPYTPAMGAL